jgi:hypothetical protein
MGVKIIYKDIKDYINKTGGILNTTNEEFVVKMMHSESKLDITCKCGGNMIKSFKNYKKFQNCSICMKKNKTKLKYSDVFDFVSESKGKLNTTSKEFEEKIMTVNSIFDIICRCGVNIMKTFANFKSYPRCKKCKSIRDYDEILTFIINSGGNLVTSKEAYKKSDLNTKLNITCSCGKKILKSFTQYKNNTKCRTCNDPSIYSYSKILTFITESGGILNTTNEEFINKKMNSISNLDITCNCGGNMIKSFRVYKNNTKCKFCNDQRKYCYKDILTFITESGCILNTTNEEFVVKIMHSESKLDITCKCGNNISKAFQDYKRSQGCHKCSGETRKTSYKEIKYFIDESGSKLLTTEEEYKKLNSHSTISIICLCGENILKSFTQYKIRPNCQKCGDEKRNVTNIEKYGYKNPFQNEKIKMKIKTTNIEKYGYENPMQNENIKLKTKETWKTNYGTDHPMQSNEIQNKSKLTNMMKYKVEYYFQTEEFKLKSKDTCLEKYGYENPLQNENIKLKSKATCLEKYGVEHPMQNPEVFDNLIKKLYTKKEYILPSGNVIYLQGYEPFYMDILLKSYDEKEILSDAVDMPEFFYYLNCSNKPHVYYPDFYIPKDNLIIEIKSTWTLSRDIIKNMQKFKTIKYSNFNFKLIIFNKKKNFLK